MAKGRSCPCCGYHMYAQQETQELKGSHVTYVCRNGACKKCKGKCTQTEKVFEGK